MILINLKYTKKRCFTYRIGHLRLATTKGAEKFLGGGEDYPEVEINWRYHAPGSLEGWIVLKKDNLSAI